MKYDQLLSYRGYRGAFSVKAMGLNKENLKYVRKDYTFS
jgi:hypothetical protein